MPLRKLIKLDKLHDFHGKFLLNTTLMWIDRKLWVKERGLLWLIWILLLSWKPKSLTCHHWSICSNPLCLGTELLPHAPTKPFVPGINRKLNSNSCRSQHETIIWHIYIPNTQSALELPGENYQEKTAGETFVPNTPRIAFPAELPPKIHMLASEYKGKLSGIFQQDEWLRLSQKDWIICLW